MRPDRLRLRDLEVTRVVVDREVPTPSRATRDRVTRDRVTRDRLRRLEGQLGGIVRMFDEGRSCDEVVTQLMAARAALDRAAAQIVADHADDCLRGMPPAQARAKVRAAIGLLARLG